MSYVERSEGSRWTIGGIVAAVIGFGLAQFLGTSVIFPLIGAGAAFAVQTKLLDVHGPRAVLVAGLAGHTLWMLLGAIFVEGGFAAVAWDLIIQLGLICWLLARSSTAAAVITILLEVAVAALNIWQLSGDMTADKPLFVHLIIRLTIISAAAMLVVQNVRGPRSENDENERLAEIYR